MANEVEFAGDASRPVSASAQWRQWLALLLVAAGLWAVAVGQLLVSVPRSIAAAQQFNMRLPWYMEAVWSTPVWLLGVVAVLACLLGLRCRGWLRLALLVGAPVAVAVAIHLSVYGTQAKLVWGLLH